MGESFKGHGIFLQICVNHNKQVIKQQNKLRRVQVVNFLVSRHVRRPADLNATDSTRFRTFLHYDNKQQIQVTIRNGRTHRGWAGFPFVGDCCRHYRGEDAIGGLEWDEMQDAELNRWMVWVRFEHFSIYIF